MSDDGPFRLDGRVERRARCAPPEVVPEMLWREPDTGRVFVGYLVVLGVGAGVAALTLPGAALTGALSAATALAGAVVAAYARARGKTLTEAQRDALPLRCALTPEGLVLEGNTGQSLWRYEGVRALTRVGPWLVVTLHGNFFVVLRDDDDEGAPLASFLAGRAKHLSAEEPAHRVRRRLVALAVTYGLVVLGAACAARLGLGP